MQFSDGNRIDLHLQPIDSMLKEYGSDKLTVPLLDKKQYLPQIEEASDEDYWVKKPSKEEFFCTCNEFWWVAPYCAKGLWREEILYSNDVLNSYVRIQLLKMLSWKAGIETNFKKSMGKSYKYLNKYIDKELWYQLVETYNLSSVDNTWNSLFKTCDLFNKVALEVSYKLNYSYNTKEAKQSSKFIRDIFELPKNAKNIY
jgi:aminoglycoside 6-adenylyltransferase